MTAAVAVPTKEKYRIDFLKAHTTYKNAAGVKVPGVTTVLGILSKQNLLKWAWTLGSQGISLNAPRDHAATIGTVAHALCEATIRGMELDTGNIAPETVDKAQIGLLRFLSFWDKEQFTIEEVELPMVSEIMQVGGTLDILANNPANERILLDIKTSKGVFPEMLLQVSAYAAIYEEVTGRTISEAYIVRIGKEDADELEVVRVLQRTQKARAFAALATAYRLMKEAEIRL
jgi:hypothetical protein